MTSGTPSASSSSSSSSAAAATIPPFIPATINFVTTHFRTICNIVDKTTPQVEAAYKWGCKKWIEIQPYHPEDIIPMIIGLALVLFGGQFILLISAVEAFRLTSYSTVKTSVIKLYQTSVKALEIIKSKKDDDGATTPTPSTTATTTTNKKSEPIQQQLLSQKVLLILRAVDPEDVQQSLIAVYTGLVAVVAALRVRFAKTIALGTSIGEIFAKGAHNILHPPLLQVVPPAYQKWINPGIRIFTLIISVFLAWFVQRLISTFHCATRGAQMLVSNGVKLAQRKELISAAIEEGDKVYQTAVTALAVFGVMFQLWSGFGLSFPFNLLLFPAVLTEYFLQFFVSGAVY